MASGQLDDERIFHIARKITDSETRVEYLDQICAGDQALRERVEALLAVHQQEQSFLKSNGNVGPTVDRTPITEEPGQVIGRYKLLQKIGEGGFGVVYMAEQERPVRRKVALKIIKPGMDTHSVVARFEAERQALALMDHLNIARVLDGGATESGRPYFVMELVKGVPVTEYCDKNQLSTEVRLELFIEVCQAVQHAHQKGIIHRDLKPSNILVTLHDGEPVVKVIDFGVAKATNQRLTEKTLFTSYGEMIGTPQYMSPEQAEMSGLDVDTRSDIYSLGVVLYELLTGTTPLEAERLRTAGYGEMQRLIQEDEPPKPSTRLSSSGDQLTIIAKHRSLSPEQLQKTVRGDLDWIVMKALEKDRSRRYDTPSSFASDCSRFLSNEPVNARPPSTTYRFGKWVRRNRAIATAGGVVLLVLLIGVIGTATGWRRAISEAENARKTAEKLRAKNRDLQETQESLIGTLFDQGMLHALSANIRETNEMARRLRILKADDLADKLEALRLIHAGEFDAAIELLKVGTTKSPNSVGFWALLSNAYDGKGDLQAAFAAHAKLQTLAPETAEDCYFATRAYALDPKTGLEYADRAVEESRSPVLMLSRGRMLADYAIQAGIAERTEEALRDITTLTWHYGTTGWLRVDILATYVLVASTRRAAGDEKWAEVLDEAQLTVQSKERAETTVVWEKLYSAMYYQLLGAPEKALELYRQAAEDDAGDYATLLYLAAACEMGSIQKGTVPGIRERSLGPFSEVGCLRLLVLEGKSQEAKTGAYDLAEKWSVADIPSGAAEILYLAGEPEAASELARELLHVESDRPISIWGQMGA